MKSEIGKNKISIIIYENSPAVKSW